MQTEIFEKLIHMASDLGGVVVFAPFESQSEGILVADEDSRNISFGLRAEMDFEKYVYNLAHELAHYFLHYDKGNTITSEKHAEYEEQADRAVKMLLAALSVSQKGGAKE